MAEKPLLSATCSRWYDPFSKSGRADHDQLKDAACSLVADSLAASAIGLQKTKEVMTRTAEIEDLAAVVALQENTGLAGMHDQLAKFKLVEPIRPKRARMAHSTGEDVLPRCERCGA
jgi:hypothetical protein